jgi:nucleoid-associated protein YgaU
VRDEEMIDLDGLPLEEEEEEEEDDEEYEDDSAGDESEVEESASEEDSSETEAAGDDEWGFGEKKSRFSKEVLFGIATVAVLCGVFGVVVWQNLGKNSDGEEVASSPEGELGDEGKPGPQDPFTTGKGEFRTAAHIEVGEGIEKPAEEEPFIAAGTGGEMGTFHKGELGGSIGGLQGEPAIEEGINTADTGTRLDPFGQPLNSRSTGIGETRIGDGTLGSTTGPGTTFEREQPTGPFEPRNDGVGAAEGTLTGTAIGERVGSETGGKINPFETRPDPFGAEETKPRADEFGRPIDEFGRPIETASTGIGETTQPLLDPTGTEIRSTEIGEGTPMLGDRSIGIAETSTGIGESTTGIGETTPGLSEGTTELFPSGAAGSTTRISEKPTGLFEPQPTTDGSLASSTPGIGETTGTPGFESNTRIGPSETETFLLPETSSTAGTGTLPFESAFPTSTGTGSLPDTGTFEPAIGSETGTTQPGFETGGTGSLPVIGSPDTNPFGSTGSTTIVGGYPIQPGDSYWTISKKLYGTARYFRVLAEYNSKAIPDPSRMRPGMTISTPDEAVLRRMLLANSSTSAGSAEARRPAGAPPVTPAQGIFFDEKNQPRYRVGKDDTLTTIAAEHLGRWARWRQIFEMNKDQMDNPNKLQIGMILKLPADATRTSMSRRDNRVR